MAVSLVLGGARSGKSRFAQTSAELTASKNGVRPVMIVTAEIYDDEMAERVRQHRQDRSGQWDTVESPHAVADAIARLGASDVAVVDCMTLWLTNLMLAECDLETEIARLLEALQQTPARVWVVSNEVGWGIVPDNALARRFRDEAGRLNQRLAVVADDAWLIVAGMKIPLERF